MNMACARFPCGMTSSGYCQFTDCANGPRQNLGPFPGFAGAPWTPQPMGCICPPTSEKTCESPMCPRKNNLSASGPIGAVSQDKRAT